VDPVSEYKYGESGPRFEHKERHTKEDALSDFEFELLYEAAVRLPEEYYSLQAQFIVMVLGRLGLRRGELGHLESRWLNWDQKFISIPRHKDCDCGDCRLKAQQKVDHNEEIDFETAIAHRWHPKTETAIRDVPFSFSARVELVLKRFFDRFDGWPHSSQTINRRLKRTAENTDAVDSGSLYPHALRATAASYHAGRGLGILPLQSMFGWADLVTPMKYVKASGVNTARELKMVHNR
jgi:integrase